MPTSPSPHTRRRSRSPDPSSHPHKRRRQHDSPPRHSARELPFSASSLSKHNLSAYRPLFSLYLDIQKKIYIEDIAEDEVKGRWKSFVKKWNNGDLAEGWYEPTTLEKALKAQTDPSATSRVRSPAPATSKDGNEDEDEFGPAPPGVEVGRYGGGDRGRRSGPDVPSVDEIRARREEAQEDAVLEREKRIEDVRAERRVDREMQKERLDELAPRAAGGTRERQLEKKREANAVNKSFANAAHEAGDVELRDNDLMGEDGLTELKRMKQQEDRKKNERELRREEILRARKAERDERLKGVREKEEKTMEYLKSLAKERFG